MTGKCDKCDKIFNSHDGGWVCPKCGYVVCPECEMIPEGSEEPTCQRPGPLDFIMNRLICVHGENPNVDYMQRLREIAEENRGCGHG
jgi:hypothetical protein